MNTALLRNRYRMLPNQRAIDHYPTGKPMRPLNGCVRRPWTMREIQLFSNTAGMDTERASFLIPAASITDGQVPANGEKLTDDESISWTILSVGRELEGSMLRVTCVKQS